jgi:8-oxo-dGTP diphosphatase
MKKPSIALVVEAIIKDDSNNILLLKRSNNNNFFKGQWQLAGGKVEFGEDVNSALRREIFEETGCVCVEPKVEKIFSIKQEFNGFKGTLFLMVFSCTINGKIKISADHNEFGFFNLDDIKKISLTKISKKSLFG